MWYCFVKGEKNLRTELKNFYHDFDKKFPNIVKLQKVVKLDFKIQNTFEFLKKEQIS